MFVDNTLLRHCEHNISIPIGKFELDLTIVNKKMASSVDNWLWVAVQKGAKHLFLSLCTSGMIIYTLPRTIFAADSLVSLEVYATDYDDRSIRFSFGGFQVGRRMCCNLKRLNLNNVNVDDSTIGSLSSIFLSIEKLTLEHCWGCERFRSVIFLTSENSILSPTLMTMP